MTAADLTLDFPPHHQGRRNLRGVTFARTAQLYIVQRHEDNEENKVARHELWYTKSEYDRMNLSVKEDVIKLHAKAVEGDPFDYSGDCDDDASSNKSSVCCVGIEHLLSLACVLGVKACRKRCIRAVIAEQTRQGPSSKLRWEAIALASLATTKKAAIRAREFGKLHRDSA